MAESVTLTGVLIEVAGGLGLFLLGMALMTEGLKAMAGDHIRSYLMRFTRSPFTGVLTGVAGTAVLQSSTATIIATVGFVGAGLLSFSQALGIILGSALGTTFTGWLVAVVGFKLQFGTLALLLVFTGALMRLFGGRKRAGPAFALAGFGLIFVGIAALQEGMSGLQGFVDFSRYPADSLWGKLLLVLAGVIFTIMTQSSSAGVVAALTAVHTGAIDFQQAAALVVGMNIGTSFTAAVATIGGSVHVRRTGFSHVIYNTFTSSVALFLIVPYILLWERLSPGYLYGHAELALVGFHTSFNLLGVILVLPFAGQFARFIERLFPERPMGYEKVLDKSLLKHPELALTAVQKLLLEQIRQVAEQLAYLLGETSRATSLLELERELLAIQEYLDSVHVENTAGNQWTRLLACIEIVDHLQRLHDRCENKSVQMSLRDYDHLQAMREPLLALINTWLAGERMEPEQLQSVVDELTRREGRVRGGVTEQIARGKVDLRQGVALMEAARWLQHVASHIERIELAARELNYEGR